VVYGKGGGDELKLDLYTPTRSSGPLPALVFLHGGGWCMGSKADCRDLARFFAEHGYFTVSVGYRLTPGHRFPAQLEDAKCAVRWLRANAAYYHVDAEAIGAVGVSAGAHLALLLGLTGPANGFEGEGGYAEQSSQVQAVVNVMGPTDLTRPGWPEAVDKILVDLLGGGRDKLAVAYRAASPLTYVAHGAPPVLTIHGTSDLIVPYEQAQLLHTALRDAGVTSWLETVRDKGHAFDWTPEDWQRFKALILAFADKHLKRR
jgi:acetyl esterase/lipase